MLLNPLLSDVGMGGKMPVAWMHADMLEYPMQTITNTVNCVGAMGKGLALQFKRKFPMYNDDYILKCRDSDYSPGINAGASTG